MANINLSFTDQEFIDEGYDFYARHEMEIRRRVQEAHESFMFMTPKFNVPDRWITASQGVTELAQAYRAKKHDKGNIFHVPFVTIMRDQKVNWTKDILKGFRSYVNNFRDVSELANAVPYSGEIIRQIQDGLNRDAENQSAQSVWRDPVGLADDVVPETINGTDGYYTKVKELVKTGKLVPVLIDNSFTAATTYDFHRKAWRSIPTKYRYLPMNVMESKDLGDDYWLSYVDEFGDSIAERRAAEAAAMQGPNLNVTGITTVPAMPQIEQSSCIPRPVFGMNTLKTIIFTPRKNLLKIFGPQDFRNFTIKDYEPHTITYAAILQYVFGFDNAEELFVAGEIIEAPRVARLGVVTATTAELNIPEVAYADTYTVQVSDMLDFSNIVFNAVDVASNIVTNIVDKVLPDNTLEKTAILEQSVINATGLTADTVYYVRAIAKMTVADGKIAGQELVSAPGEGDKILTFKTTL